MGVGVGVGVAVAVGLPDGSGVDVLVPDPVPPVVGVDVGVAEDEVPPDPDDALGELDAFAELDALGELEADAELEDDGALDELAEPEELAVADDEAAGVAAIAVEVTPLETTKRPVARPSVTGRECDDRIENALSVVDVTWGNVLFGLLSQFGGKSFVLVTDPPIRHQHRLWPPPPATG